MDKPLQDFIRIPVTFQLSSQTVHFFKRDQFSMIDDRHTVREFGNQLWNQCPHQNGNLPVVSEPL